MIRYRKRPVVVDAIQWTGENWAAVARWLEMAAARGDIAKSVTRRGHSIEIATLEGTVAASVLDWVICGTAGELYPCKPDIFAEIYEEVEVS